MKRKDKTQEIFKKVKKENIKFIYLQFSDVTGALKSVSIQSDIFQNAIESGLWFDGSSIQGFARIFESDMLLRPDLNTFHVLPWSEPQRKTARVICDVYLPNGQPFEGDPRYVLKRITEMAWEMGYTYNIGAEVEFFLLDRNTKKPHDGKGYFDYTTVSRATEICENVIMALAEFGIKGEVYHHEVAPGQHEIDIRFDEALKSADNIITLKTAIKAYAAPNTSLIATFMPKPFQGMNGSGMHVHQSIFRGQRNIFFDAKDKYNLSPLAYHFIAGQMKHAKGISAIVAPTVNSYKRLVPGYEAPCYICWCRINRSALIRIPSASPGKESISARAELRCPDPYCNPYLAFTAILAAGLDGIKKKIKISKPTEEDVYLLDNSQLKKLGIETLPSSLSEAIEWLNKDEVIKEALGPTITKSFIKAKRSEIEQMRLEVTPQEIEHYL